MADDLSERYVVNYTKDKFEYRADSGTTSYHTTGSAVLNKNILTFEFPEHAEEVTLSPFAKGYYELVKLSESDSFEIDVDFYDITYGHQLGINRHNKPNFIVLSFEDSTQIRKIPFPRLRYKAQSDSIFIKTEVEDFFEQYIMVPSKGNYNLTLYLQRILTHEFYETTTAECYLRMSRPIVLAKVSSIQRDSILSFRLLDNPQIEYFIKN